MSGKLPKTQVLITSSFVRLKTTTSLLRKSGNLFTTKSLFLASIFIVIYLSCSTNGTSLRRTENTSMVDLYEKSNPSFNDNLFRKTRRLCYGYTYQQCFVIQHLIKFWRKKKLDQTQTAAKPFLLKTKPTANQPSTVTSATILEKTTSSKLPVHHHPRSRRKRLASGDRRLVHMYCRTRYVLEIQKNGSVVGVPTKTESAVLEIQAVAPNGVIRFYSPSTDRFLAMDDRGRLYGTKIYTEEHCAFEERIQENMWTTYSSQILPNKKKRRSRYKRNTERAWYVAIGKRGKPRKASRIRPSQNSAQFLPRPLS